MQSLKLLESTNGVIFPLPVRAIFTRIFAQADRPSWAAYLPEELRALTSEGWPDLSAAAASSLDDGQRLGSLPECHAAGVGQDTDLDPLGALSGRVWAMSREPSSCREVQRALEEATSDAQREAIVRELKGHVWEALRCPHANYVLQKCIVTSRPQAMQFVIDELLKKGPGAAQQAACHRFGCRILERLLEQCLPDQVNALVADLLNDVVGLATHLYGNYVIQHLIEYGSSEQRRHVARLLVPHVREIGLNVYGSAVLLKALGHAKPEDQRCLARALVAEPGLFLSLSRGRPTSPLATLALQVLAPGAEREAARRLLGLRSGRSGLRGGDLSALSEGISSTRRGGAALAAVGGG